MGISFKISQTGKRFRPKPPPPGVTTSAVEEEVPNDAVITAPKKKTDGEVSEEKNAAEISDHEVSFSLTLFLDGYSIVKPVENGSNETSVEIPKFLHPYDRASETLFSAIESGRLPGDILNDIPCKFVDGTVTCEVRDYRKCTFDGLKVISRESSPIINRVCLRMSLENIVKDIPDISNTGWTYGDLMEVESRILKALQPQLLLDPSPQLDKLSGTPVSTKLNLEIHNMRRKRLRQIPEVAVSSKNINGKKVFSMLGDSAPVVPQPAYENLNSQNNVSNAMLQLRNNNVAPDGSHMSSPMVIHHSKYPVGVGSANMMRDQRVGTLMDPSAASPGGQDMMIPFSDNGTSSIHGKRGNQDGQLSSLTNKRGRFTHSNADVSLQQFGPQGDNLHGSELHWKNALMQHQSIGRGIPNGNNGMQQVNEGSFSQEAGKTAITIGLQGIRHNLKEELVEIERSDKSELNRTVGEPELTNNDSQSLLQQRMPQQFTRSNFSQNSWNTLNQSLDSNSRKEDSFQRRKLVQSPRISAGGLPQSPLSSKSGEISSGSIGPQFGAASGLVSSQKERSSVTSVGIGGNPSFISNTNDSMQRQSQQSTAKRRLNSLHKTPAMSGVGSPGSVNNTGVPSSASSPPVSTQTLGDQTMFDRFSKIEMLTMRYRLTDKKDRVEVYNRKSTTYSVQELVSHLSVDSNNESLKDETCTMPLSKSLVGGNLNVCKTRILSFFPADHILQGNSVQLVPKARTRMIMSEKPSDGAVAFHMGEIEDADYLAVEDCLPTLPNTHMADILAAQFCSLMAREGFHVEDHLQPKPVRMSPTLTGQLNAPGILSGSAVSDTQQFSEGASVQPSNDTKPGSICNAPTNLLHNVHGQRMLHPGNLQAIQMSQGLLPGVSVPLRPQNSEQLPLLQQQSQFQRAPMMLSANSMQHLNSLTQNSNMQMGSHMTNKPSPLQLQMLQQQQQAQLFHSQQQQQSAMQRKMMPGLGTVGMGNISNNMVGLGGGFNNVMGMGVARGVGGTGISSPMGAISGIGNMSQNPVNLSTASNIGHAIRSGTLTPAHAAAFMKMRLTKSNMMGNPQSSIGGMPGARQMQPGSPSLSMLGSALNRANINQIQQRTATGQMGPPKLMSGMNLYMNQQQQQQQLQLQQQQIHQLQQQQMQQQQQEMSSPLQAVVSPQQVGSPSSIGIPHQMNQPQQQASSQQMSQRTPMSPQLSSGAMHPMNTGNPEACPASPQLSSQTLGSVGSITNSSMELQGVNKSNSINNG